MTPQDIQNIHDVLRKRVVPRDADEGAALRDLAIRLVQHFAREFAPKVKEGAENPEQPPTAAPEGAKRPRKWPTEPAPDIKQPNGHDSTPAP